MPVKKAQKLLGNTFYGLAEPIIKMSPSIELDELVTGVVEIACVDAVRMKPAPIPEFLHSKLEALQ